MNPYTGGTCRDFNTDSASRAICTRVTPGGRSPFSGRSSNVIATFCAEHTAASRRRSALRTYRMRRSLQEEAQREDFDLQRLDLERVPHPSHVLCEGF